MTPDLAQEHAMPTANTDTNLDRNNQPRTTKDLCRAFENSGWFEALPAAVHAQIIYQWYRAPHGTSLDTICEALMASLEAADAV